MEDTSRHNGWTFNPTDETWFARTGESTWTVVPGALDNPPTWLPESAR